MTQHTLSLPGPLRLVYTRLPCLRPYAGWVVELVGPEGSLWWFGGAN